MPTDIRLPVLGEGADSGTIVSVLVKEGDDLKKDDNVIELENEKAVAAIPSPTSGKVTKVHVAAGQKISVGQLILSVDSPEIRQADIPAEPPQRTRESPAPTSTVPAPSKTASASTIPGIPPAASPTIRKMAQELGIDLSRINGTGPGGRMLIEDLRAYIQRLQSLDAEKANNSFQTKTATNFDFEKWGPVRRAPMTSLRKIIAQRMQESSSTIPHVTQFEEVEIDTAISIQQKLAPEFAKKGLKLTFTPLILKALVKNLKKHPIFNSSIDEDRHEIVFKDYFHIGIAVDTEQGLIVPVIHDVDKKDLLQLGTELRDIAEKTRQRKISSNELKGGTFTISNQGAIGGGFFTPIINKPEVGILGLGRSFLKPVAREGRVEIRTILPVALSYDHRVIDGAQAARFVVDLSNAFAQFSESDFT